MEIFAVAVDVVAALGSGGGSVHGGGGGGGVSLVNVFPRPIQVKYGKIQAFMYEKAFTNVYTWNRPTVCIKNLSHA